MYYINVNVAPFGQPANRAFRIGHNVRAGSADEALRLLAQSLQLRGLRVVSVVTGGV